MPNCFQLFLKGTTTPYNLHTLDAELCTLLGVEVHPVHYVAGWFDSIGWMIAVNGMSFAQIRAALTLDCVAGAPISREEHERQGLNKEMSFIQCTAHEYIWRVGSETCTRNWKFDGKINEERVRILDYIEERFTSNAWVEIGKR